LKAGFKGTCDDLSVFVAWAGLPIHTNIAPSLNSAYVSFAMC
jgi:hypothetical protein